MGINRDKFREGFYRGLAESGVLPSEVGGLVKQAGAFGDVVGYATTGAKNLYGFGDALGGVAVGLPLLAGALGGTAAYQLTRPDYNASIKKLQQAEVINELRQQTRRLQDRNRRKELEKDGQGDRTTFAPARPA
jgi:hypothetical protein